MKEIVKGDGKYDYMVKFINGGKYDFIMGDLLDVNNLDIFKNAIVKGKNLMFKFDTARRKLSKKECIFIENTKHSVIVMTEDLRSVPAGVRKVCKVINV